MSHPLNANTVGVTLGGTLGLWHLCWSFLIALGWAQPLLDGIFRLHMIQPAFTVTPFSIMSAALLVIATAALGYVVGYVCALMWNALEKNGRA